MLLLLFVHGRAELWLIYLVAFLYGLVYTFLSAGQSALLKVMLPDELIGDARGVLTTVREGLRLVGPLTGAGLFAVAGAGWSRSRRGDVPDRRRQPALRAR